MWDQSDTNTEASRQMEDSMEALQQHDKNIAEAAINRGKVEKLRAAHGNQLENGRDNNYTQQIVAGTITPEDCRSKILTLEQTNVLDYSNKTKIIGDIMCNEQNSSTRLDHIRKGSKNAPKSLAFEAHTLYATLKCADKRLSHKLG